MSGRAGVSFLLAAALCAFLCGCAAEPVSRTGFAFDTVISVTVHSSGNGNEKALDACFEKLFYLDGLWDRFDESSEIGALNALGRGELSPVTAGLLFRAVEYNRLTGGYFDIALGALSDAWGFGGIPGIPSDETLEAALEASGMDKLALDESRAELSNGAKIDLGSIAKGAAADMAADTLRENGVTSAIIDLGGNIVCIGCAPDGKPFMVGIQKPFGQAYEISAIVPVRDESVVTSGVYKRYFERDGAIYPHIIDPATGMTCSSDIISATVITKSAELADSLTTALMLMGSEAALEFMSDFDGAQAVFITSDMRVLYTEGLNGLIEITG